MRPWLPQSRRKRYRTNWAIGVSRTRSARRSTCKCRETVGWGSSSTAWRSETNSGAAERQLRMRSRVGSATVSRRSVAEAGAICAETYIFAGGCKGGQADRRTGGQADRAVVAEGQAYSSAALHGVIPRGACPERSEGFGMTAVLRLYGPP